LVVTNGGGADAAFVTAFVAALMVCPLKRGVTVIVVPDLPSALLAMMTLSWSWSCSPPRSCSVHPPVAAKMDAIAVIDTA
jgi:hypothetical protein